MSRSRPLALVAAALAAVLAAACGSELPLAEEAGELTLSPTFPTPQPVVSTPNRLLWNDGGDGELWWVTTRNTVFKTQAFPRGPDWVPAGVAGDKLLWHKATAWSQRTELWTLDAYGGASYVVILPPVPGARAVSLSLAQTYRGECWRPDLEQRYHLLWDTAPSWEHPNGQFIVQLVDGSGYPYRTVFTDKPMYGLAAVSFGKGANAWDHVVFRANDGAAWIYDAALQAGAGGLHYQTTLRHTERVSGYRFASASVKYDGGILNPGWRDQLLFTSATGNGEALLVVQDDSFNTLYDVTHTAASGMLATSYTTLPSQCN